MRKLKGIMIPVNNKLCVKIMSMDQLQVIALILELTGIGLTIIHIYKNDFSKSASGLIERSVKFIGLDQFANVTGGIDYDFTHLSKEEREQVFHTRMVTILGAFILTLILFSTVDYGTGILWNFAEFISAYFQSFIYIILVQYTLVAIVGSILYVCRWSGRGDTIIGIGLGLAGVGLIIEAIQIYFSSLNWTLWVILAFLALFISIPFVKNKLLNSSD